MKKKILIFLSRLNIIYPYYLGVSFIKYRVFFKKNYHFYDNNISLFSAVNNSLRSIPFYLINNIPNIQTNEEFKKLIPIIDKLTIMNNRELFILPDYNKSKTVEGTTGGTSGKPLRLLIPKNRYIVELNTMNSMWKNVGWKGEIRGVIRNKQLTNNQIFIVNPFKKEIIFDGFNTDDDYYEKIYQTLVKYKIKFIHCYPSSAYQFSLFLKKYKKDTSLFKAFLCGSEGLTDLQYNLIKNELGINIYNWYGHSEKLVLGGPCKNNDAIHIEPTYGYFELLDENNNEITTPGELGEIVGTSINNPYMPFIRYRTGDYAEYVGNYCESCKRHLILIKNIQGRWDSNKIFLNDNTYVTITALNLHSDLYHYIEGMQYIQKEKGKLEIYLVRGNEYNTDVENRFKVHFENSLKGKCTFELIYIQETLKEKNGKFLPLKQLTKLT